LQAPDLATRYSEHMKPLFDIFASIVGSVPGKPAACGWMLATLMLCAPIAEAAPPTTGEIEELITSLGASGCDFQRNGSWYPARKAEEHLRRKYAYLRESGKAVNAEQFIALAGTRSSMTGRAYRVRCPGRPVVDSADWLRARLLGIRKASSPR
jgi:hypothetical protein